MYHENFISADLEVVNEILGFNYTLLMRSECS